MSCCENVRQDVLYEPPDVLQSVKADQPQLHKRCLFRSLVSVQKATGNHKHQKHATRSHLMHRQQHMRKVWMPRLGVSGTSKLSGKLNIKVHIRWLMLHLSEQRTIYFC
jgi:hypothetical protein